MTSTISVGTDGSQAADAAVAWAAREADRRGFGLTIVHVCEFPIPAYERYGIHLEGYEIDVQLLLEGGRRLATASAAETRQQYPDLDVNVVVERGDVGQLLVETSRNTALTVVGTNEKRSPTDVLLGSNTLYTLHHSHSDVVVVPCQARAESASTIGKLIVGIDGSDSSGRAFEWALREALIWNIGVEAVFAWNYSLFGRANSAQAAFEQIEIEATNELDATINEAHAKLSGLAEVSVNTTLVNGSASAALMNAAGPNDLIVVGNRGRGGFRSIVLGSVSQQLAQHAPCPVAVIKF